MKTFSEWLWSRKKAEPQVQPNQAGAARPMPAASPSPATASSSEGEPMNPFNSRNPIGRHNAEESDAANKAAGMTRVQNKIEELSQQRNAYSWFRMRGDVYDFVTGKTEISPALGREDKTEYTREELAEIYKGVTHNILEQMSKSLQWSTDFSPKDVPAGWGRDADKWLRSFLNKHLTSTQTRTYGLHTYSLKGLPSPEDIAAAEEIYEVWKSEHDRNNPNSRSTGPVDKDKLEDGIRRLAYIRHPR